jgi:hypothetical protein
MSTSLSLVKIFKNNIGEYLEVPFTEYFHNISETSYKRWSLKDTFQTWKNGAWQTHDLVFNLFSTGKASFNGKIVLNDQTVTQKWRIELLDNNKAYITTVKFAPIIFNNSKIGKARKIKFEKRVTNLDLELLSKIAIVRIYPG